MESNSPEAPKENKILQKSELISFAADLGISIAIPLCILAYSGKTLDSKYGTFPMIFLIAIFLSFFITTVIIYFKIKKYIKK